ncbi:homocysteine S-methyltransferase family protein [Nocardioides eburneiflavus]|nr:homocysteine S-methyltransferase family protein [Nocardioides eburneiflavus]
MPRFDDVFKRSMVILDCEMSNALEDRGHDLSDDLWTARLLRGGVAEIAAMHRAYFEAGADVATASYRARMPQGQM